ncbi:MAG: LamG domain-containing protein [Bacteroidota bacterium]|nr:LamG domain-containing protein [Bacteroidota bacterium]
MNLKIKLSKYVALTVVVGLLFSACQKLERPALGDYPVDAYDPNGPLKFYAAFDAGNVDSVTTISGTDHNVSYVPGLKGQAVQFDGSKNGYVSFGNVNGFGASTNFTISFWINITLSQKDNNHAVGVLAFANSQNFWGNATFYADNNAKSPSDSMDLKIHFNDVGTTDNWNYAGYNFDKAWPHMYDGQWHQVAFTYDAAAKTGTVYRDGVQFDQKTGQSIKFENSSKLIAGGFQEADGIKDTYANNTWMAGFPGKMDNIKLYSRTLSAAEIATSFANKD